MKIPLVDLKIQYLQIKDEIDSAIQDVINNTAFIKGAYVDKFESEFKNFYGVNHCIGVANGTDAYISLKSLGIGLGDEVITVANTWISTSETISQTGAKPVFIDIDKDFYTINVNQIKSKITGKTKAIIPVHLFGHPTNINEIMQIAKDYGLKVIEDCAQAHFSSWDKNLLVLLEILGHLVFFQVRIWGLMEMPGVLLPIIVN